MVSVVGTLRHSSSLLENSVIGSCVLSPQTLGGSMDDGSMISPAVIQ